MSKAKLEHLDGRFAYPAAAAHLPGDVVLRPDGTYAIFDGLEACEEGERIQPQPIVPGPTVIFEKDSAAEVLTAGDAVYIIPASGKVTATAAGNVATGKVIQTAGNGITHVHVNPQA